MQQSFWQALYSEQGSAYGVEPNAFLRQQTHRLAPGSKVLVVTVKAVMASGWPGRACRSLRWIMLGRVWIGPWGWLMSPGLRSMPSAPI